MAANADCRTTVAITSLHARRQIIAFRENCCFLHLVCMCNTSMRLQSSTCSDFWLTQALLALAITKELALPCLYRHAIPQSNGKSASSRKQKESACLTGQRG